MSSTWRKTSTEITFIQISVEEKKFSKQLEINIDKSSFIILGNKNKVKEIREQIAVTPLTLNNNEIKEKSTEKYLGDYLHKDGNEASIQQTITNRKWRIMSSILEIKIIIEDFRINSIGGVLTGINLWELAVIPMMLNNCGTWDEINSESMKKLNNLQNTLMQYLLKTPKTTPTPSLAWDFGILPIKYRVMIRKLCLAKHIISLGKNSLANEIFNAQNDLSYPGLAKEIKMHGYRSR